MKTRAIAIVNIDRSTNVELMNVTFIFGSITKGLAKTDFKVSAEKKSFIDLYNEVLKLAKLNNFKINYYEDFGGRFYDIFWNDQKQGQYNARRIITDNFREV